METTTTQCDLKQLADVRLIERSGENARPARGKPLDLAPLPVRRTVMIVDDSEPMLDLLVRVLAKENYDIIVAASGPDALRKAGAHEGPIDLLVTDYSMPGMHGRELAARMRDRRRDLPVLYETGFTDLLFDGRHELDDRSAFLEKPFTPRGLREATRLMLFGTLNPR